MNEEENTPKEYDGKKYTAYEAQQRQRKLETAMRADRQQIELLTQGGVDDDTITGAKVKYFQRQDEYVKFSKAMNLPQQWERVTVNGKNALGSKTPKKARNALPVVAQQPVRTAIQTETLKSKSTDKFMSYNRNKTVAKLGDSSIIKAEKVSDALNPNSQQAQKHADRYYEAVRHMKTDVEKIANNTGLDKNDISNIKDYIFMQKHDLGGDESEYFYPSYEMSQSWQRLIEGKNIQKHDMTLLHHEIMERELMRQGYSQYEAHKITEQKFNYGKECKEYYAEISKYSKE